MSIQEENEEMQRDEILALCAIYGDTILTHDHHNSTDTQKVYNLTLNVDQDVGDDISSLPNQTSLPSPRIMVLRLFFPQSYPSNDMPVFEMTSVYCGNTRIDSLMVNTIQQAFQSLFHPGQVVLFEWIQWLEDYIRCHVEEAKHLDTPAADRVRQGTSNTSSSNEDDGNMDILEATTSSASDNSALVFKPHIFSSRPLVDRKSTFVAHVSNVKNADQVKKVISTLLENKKIARATHNIMAYRINLQPGDCILQDNDDDGETAAGGRLMHLLQILDVKNVVVVVSRWFGGILLGPDRFKDINNCARQALEDCGYVHAANNKKGKRRS